MAAPLLNPLNYTMAQLTGPSTKKENKEYCNLGLVVWDHVEHTPLSKTTEYLWKWNLFTGSEHTFVFQFKVVHFTKWHLLQSEQGCLQKYSITSSLRDLHSPTISHITEESGPPLLQACINNDNDLQELWRGTISGFWWSKCPWK